MSNASIGKQYERECKQVLLRTGWQVHQASPKAFYVAPGVMRTKQHDIFGCWDVVAKKLGEKTLWIQVSTWEMVSVKKKQVEDFPWTLSYDEPCIWGRVRGEKIFKVMYARDGYKWMGRIEEIG